MGRFPVTLYKEQWLKLLAMSDDIRAFIAANKARTAVSTGRVYAGASWCQGDSNLRWQKSGRRAP